MTKQFELTDLLFVFTEKSPKLPTEFAIEIDDRGELYLQSLTNILRDIKRIDKVALRRLEYGDTIVFTKNEVYVETNPRIASKLRITTLSLVNDYNKIEKTIKNFFKNTFVGKTKEEPNCCKYCPLKSTCYNKHDDRIYDGQYISVEEKVSIMYNFVKVGYDQYDIVNLFGNQVVTIEDELFEVKKDRNGKKYLQLL